MAWRALTKVNLPYLDEQREEVTNEEGDVVEVRILSSGRLKNPGDEITAAEFKEAQQSDEQIAELVKQGAIEEV
jgi:hypothetical protein